MQSFQTNGGTVMLGRVRPKAVPQALRFANYITAAQVTAPPMTVDYSEKALRSLQRMYLNDKYGCCVISGKMHQIGLWTGNDSPETVLATDKEVLDAYNLLKAGPGDSGCIITHVLDYMKARGLIASGKRYTIDGYVAIDYTSELETRIAQYLFGTLTVGINIPQQWIDADVWDTTSSKIVGGHDVSIVGVTPDGLKVSTWGSIRLWRWQAFLNKTYTEECYALLAPSWYGSDKVAPCGVNSDTLRVDLAKLGGGELPDIGPPPEPEPVLDEIVIPKAGHYVWKGPV